MEKNCERGADAVRESKSARLKRAAPVDHSGGGILTTDSDFYDQGLVLAPLTMSSNMPYRIDTHSHFLPPKYREALQKNGHGMKSFERSHFVKRKKLTYRRQP